jgi:hypothetical protein
MNITIKTIPYERQRYDTIADWFFEGDNLVILVSEMEDWRYEALLAIHELVEAILCQDRGIREEDVTEFDINNPYSEEPGDELGSPYRREHFFATNIERLMSEQLKVEWNNYENFINNIKIMEEETPKKVEPAEPVEEVEEEIEGEEPKAPPPPAE